MSQITGIVKSGKSKCNIFLDGGYFCTLNLETIIKAKLKVGSEISKEEIEDIQAENEKLTAFDRSLKYLSNLKTEKQVKDYLLSKGFTGKTVKYCISKLKDYEYIDDEAYANVYIQFHSNKKGKRLIKYELKAKGVNEEIIEKLLNKLEYNTDNLLYLAEKFVKNKPRDKKTAQKLFTHLMSKGFEYDNVVKTVKQIVQFEIETPD
jgi:regulatory protein